MLTDNAVCSKSEGESNGQKTSFLKSLTFPVSDEPSVASAHADEGERAEGAAAGTDEKI